MFTEWIKEFCIVYGCTTSPVVVSTEANLLEIPDKAKPYVELIKHVSDNPSREAALTEQESGWNSHARSKYAKGLRQFTDSTGRWMARTHCSHLGSYQPYNTDWSIRCGIIYTKLLQQNNNFGTYCLNRKIAEQEYNGGSAIIRELKRAGKPYILSKARPHCRRAGWACKENYSYPKHISRRQPRYESLGGTICP